MTGENLRKARKENNMSQQKLSDWLNIPKINIEQWETQKRAISPWLENLLVEKIQKKMEEKKMNKELRKKIDENYDGGFWEKVTGILHNNDTPFCIYKFEHDVEFENETYRCIIIEKQIYDPEDPQIIDSVETLLEESWKL